MSTAVDTRLDESDDGILYQAILAIIENAGPTNSEGPHVRRDYILDVLAENNHPETREEASAKIDEMDADGSIRPHPLNDLRELHEQSWCSI